jgi:hypothetical protein
MCLTLASFFPQQVSGAGNCANSNRRNGRPQEALGCRRPFQGSNHLEELRAGRITRDGNDDVAVIPTGGDGQRADDYLAVVPSRTPPAMSTGVVTTPGR